VLLYAAIQLLCLLVHVIVWKKTAHQWCGGQWCLSCILQRNLLKFYLELRLHCNENIKCVFCYKHIRKCLLQILLNITFKLDVNVQLWLANALYTRCSSRVANPISVETSLNMIKLYNGLKALVNIVFSFKTLSCMFSRVC